MALLTCQNIYKSYQPGDDILHDVTCSINPHELVSIHGVSGSGKTTLLNILALIDMPQKGELYFVEQNILEKNEKEKYHIRNNDISIIFQKYNLFPQFNVLENVIMPLMYRGKEDPKALKARAHELLEQLEIAKFAHTSIHNLSGGQQQRVAIARALLLKPKLLLADEPTANVDKVTEQIIMDIFKEYTKEGTVIVVSHNPMYRDIADKTYELNTGRLQLL